MNAPLLEGFIGWFVGTFVFYWWHRLRHAGGWWLAFHQIHHSPSRIEVLTSFYKHPLEILCDDSFSDIPLWDRLFGTYRDSIAFAERCGFPKGSERRLISMLAFRDVYGEEGA